MRSILLLFLVLAGCCLDEDCSWEWRCISSGGLTCAWVKVCPDNPPPEPEELDFESRVFSAAGGRWDVRVDVTGPLVSGSESVAVGTGAADLEPIARVGTYRRWWYHAWPAGSLEYAGVALAGTTNQIIKELPRTADPAGSGCNALSLVNPEVLAPIPEEVSLYDSVFVYSPPASQIVPTSVNDGIVVYVTSPGGDTSNTTVLQEGESTDIKLDVLGTWRFRLALFSENLCEAGAADCVVVQEQTVEVVSFP